MYYQIFPRITLDFITFVLEQEKKNDIFLVEKKLKKMNADIIRGPIEGVWASGYFYILFEDPDKIRLEVNYVPNKGVLQKNIKFNPSNDY